MTWPNTLPHKAFGTAECVIVPSDRNLTLGKRYAVLDLDIAAFGPGVCQFDYYVQDDRGLYVWVGSEDLANFIPRE